MNPCKYTAWESLITFTVKHVLWPSCFHGRVTRAPARASPYSREGQQWPRSDAVLPNRTARPTEHTKTLGPSEKTHFLIDIENFILKSHVNEIFERNKKDPEGIWPSHEKRNFWVTEFQMRSRAHLLERLSRTRSYPGDVTFLLLFFTLKIKLPPLIFFFSVNLKDSLGKYQPFLWNSKAHRILAALRILLRIWTESQTKRTGREMLDLPEAVAGSLSIGR